MTELGEIKGKTCLITGGSSGLGALYAEAFLREGAKHVAILDIAEVKGKETAEQLNETYPGRVTFIKCDVGDEDSISKSFNEVVDAVQQLDVVVNNAGIFNDSPAVWRKSCDVNWLGLVSFTLKAVQHMRKDEGGARGTIVNISSMSALIPLSAFPIYCGSKAAVLHFSQSLAQDPFEETTGIRVLTICLGATDTGLMKNMAERAYNEKVENEVEAIVSKLSIQKACLLDLWTDVLQQGLKEEVYPANMADLSHSLYVSDKGLTLKVSGYSQNLHLLVELITREMAARGAQLSAPLFEAVREVRARSYHNVLIKPHKLAKDVRMNILLEPYISPRDKAAIVHDIKLDELQAFSKQLLSKLYLQVLIQGNIEWDRAIRISENVLSTIQWEGLEENEHPNLRVHELPRGEKKVRVMSLNPHSTNSIVTNYYQGGATTRADTATLEVLMMVMEEPVFDVLRTKEQLGYSVFSMMRYTFGVLGVSVTVNTQADKFSVSHVDSRVEAFLKKFSRDVRRLGEKTLQATKTSLVQLKHTTDYELKEEVERNWREIVSGEYQFQRLFLEAEAIEKIRLSDLRSWVENHFSTGNKSHFRKLSIQVVGHKSAADGNAPAPRGYNLTYLTSSAPGDSAENVADFVSDVSAFKDTLPLIHVPRVELAAC